MSEEFVAPAIPALTLLYVPGDRPDRVAKALAAGADGVVIDLEDAVAPSHKTAAREELSDLLAGWGGTPAVQVRINARGSGWYAQDLSVVSDLPDRVAVRVPKVSCADDVADVAGRAPHRSIHALIETALGVERAFEIASAGVASLGLGEADLRSDLGVPSGESGDVGLAWARARLVNASAAAGLVPPMMSVYTNVRDKAGLRKTSELGRSIGFVGRAVIHPAQLSVVREVFTPSEEAVSLAREVVERVAGSVIDGAGTVVLSDGSFLDVAMLRAAHRTLGIAQHAR